MANTSSGKAYDGIEKRRTTDENPPRVTGAASETAEIDCIVDQSTMMLVSKCVGTDYRNIGRVLGLSESEIEAIELKENPLGTQEIAYKILDKWKKREGEKATMDKLVRFLKQIHRSDIIEEIKHLSITNEEQSNQTQQTGRDHGVFLLDLQRRLRESYKGIVLKGLPWMEEINITLRDYYVELMMIQQDQNGVDQPKKSVQLDQIFEPLKRTESNRRILVEGGPGYGKTAFSYKLCHDFAQKNDYIKHFDIALLLPLREFSGNLDEMLVKVSGVSKKDAARLLSILNDQSINAILILEGYDELPTEHRPVINSIIMSERFPHVTVVVTSRPRMFGVGNETRLGTLFTSRDVSAVANPFTVRIRITGIPKAKIDEFSEKHLSNFPSERKKIIFEQLGKLPEKKIMSESFLQCPLFLLMVILLLTEKEYKTLHELQSKTDLYKQVMNFVIRRYLTKTERKFSEKPDLFSFDHAERPFYVNLMIQFGQFSTEALKSNKLSFSGDEVLQQCSKNASIADMGLLMKGITVEGFYNKPYYEPVHKSLMEFAAAYFLWTEFSTFPRDQWDRIVCSLRPKQGNESLLVLEFLAGLMKEDAHIMFQALKPYAFEFNLCFRFLIGSLLEVEITPSRLASLLPLLPTQWNLSDKDNERFSFSPQGKEVLDFGLKMEKIKQIVWHTNRTIGLPDDVKVNALILVMHNNFTVLSECQYKSLTCTNLHCQFDEFSPSFNVWPTFLYLLPSICFQHISFSFYNSASSFFLPLLHSAMLTGSMQNVNIHRIQCTLREEKTRVLAIITDLVQKEKVGGLWLRFIGHPRLCKEEFQLFQQHIDRLVSAVSHSRLLLHFTLNNYQTANPTIDLAQLCKDGQKSWKSLRFNDIQVNCTPEIQSPTLQIQNLSISNSDCRPAFLAFPLLNSCRSTSLSCDSTFPTSFLYLEHLTELDINVDKRTLKEEFQFSVSRLKNLQILALTLKSFDHGSLSISVEEWLLQLIGYAINLKGLEIREVENNCDLATQLVHTIIRYLGAKFLSRPNTIHSTSVSQQPMLHYVLLFYSINFKGTNAAVKFFSLASTLKQQAIRKKLLPRLDIVVRNFSPSLANASSLSNVFSTTDGFSIEHDFWGMREDDALHPKQKFEFNPFIHKRISISFGIKNSAYIG